MLCSRHLWLNLVCTFHLHHLAASSLSLHRSGNFIVLKRISRVRRHSNSTQACSTRAVQWVHGCCGPSILESQCPAYPPSQLHQQTANCVPATPNNRLSKQLPTSLESTESREHTGIHVTAHSTTDNFSQQPVTAHSSQYQHTSSR